MESHSPRTGHRLSADAVFETASAYQRSAALASALELDMFTAIDEGSQTVPALAARCEASPRGIRILCDYLTMIGILQKRREGYALTPGAATFLSRRSPAYLGPAAQFFSRELKHYFDHLTHAVRGGGVAYEATSVLNDGQLWVEFARAMAPTMMRAAATIAELLGVAAMGPIRVLDVAAGHGVFGIAIATRNPKAEIVAVDSVEVLALADGFARAAGVEARYRSIPGDARGVSFGTGYDVALVANFLHHFGVDTCISLLAKVHACLVPGGRVVVLEFVPNEDRVSPPSAAGFSLTMLATTCDGDAYTLLELQDQLERAGFHDVSEHRLPTAQTVVIARK